MFSTALHRRQDSPPVLARAFGALKRFVALLAAIEKNREDAAIVRLMGGSHGRLTDDLERQIGRRHFSRGFRTSE